jgi:hypothetical protein
VTTPLRRLPPCIINLSNYFAASNIV